MLRLPVSFHFQGSLAEEKTLNRVRLKSNFCEQTGNIGETYVSFRVLGLVVSVETGLRLRGRLWEFAALHRSLRPSGLALHKQRPSTEKEFLLTMPRSLMVHQLPPRTCQ